MLSRNTFGQRQDVKQSQQQHWSIFRRFPKLHFGLFRLGCPAQLSDHVGLIKGETDRDSFEDESKQLLLLRGQWNRNTLQRIKRLVQLFVRFNQLQQRCTCL